MALHGHSHLVGSLTICADCNHQAPTSAASHLGPQSTMLAHKVHQLLNLSCGDMESMEQAMIQVHQLSQGGKVMVAQSLSSPQHNVVDLVKQAVDKCWISLTLLANLSNSCCH
ncbi:hypothetical protein [Sporisorium scitamineum]|uniref:Uncharacterized protein n=1 Tax=Sporisorium scitamineum TaxID=49012 RepID=A0A0F7RYH8_9BASI|nr:hypothetical protein [Sporisorium scitamineum]